MQHPRSPDDTEPDLSYRVFAGEAEEAARRMDAVLLMLSKRHDLRTPERLAGAARLARELRELARRFLLWPQLTEDEMLAERRRLVRELAARQHDVLAFLDALPTKGPLGRVPKPGR